MNKSLTIAAFAALTANAAKLTAVIDEEICSAANVVLDDTRDPLVSEDVVVVSEGPTNPETTETVVAEDAADEPVVITDTSDIV